MWCLALQHVALDADEEIGISQGVTRAGDRAASEPDRLDRLQVRWRRGVRAEFVGNADGFTGRLPTGAGPGIETLGIGVLGARTPDEAISVFDRLLTNAILEARTPAGYVCDASAVGLPWVIRDVGVRQGIPDGTCFRMYRRRFERFQNRLVRNRPVVNKTKEHRRAQRDTRQETQKYGPPTP